MFGERPLADAVRFARAATTNQVARFFPATYIRMTGETGRGPESITPADLAAYYWQCFDEYLEKLGVDRTSARSYLKGKKLLEYGPGDVPGVAVLFVAHGAELAVCADRFPLLRLNEFNVCTLERLLESLPPELKCRANECFTERGVVRSGYAPERIRYVIDGRGLSHQDGTIDLAVSRAVLEHVGDLLATFADMRRALRAGGIAVHLVDLKSHRLHQRNQLDFLTWPGALWNLMFSHKGAPNRLRPNAYREAARKSGLEILEMTPTGRVAPEMIDEVRPRLAAPFRDLQDEDLAWSGFWLICRPGDAGPPTNEPCKIAQYVGSP